MILETVEKQKVLIVHNYYQIPGGEDTVVANEKRLLEEHGHEVFLYTRNNQELNKLSKIQKILLPVTTIFNLRTYREVKNIIKEKNINIVHVHNTLNLISPSVYYAAFHTHKPIVQTVHNFRLLCPGATFYRDGEVCEECLEKNIWHALKYNCYRNSKLQTAASVICTVIHRLIGTYKKLNYICLTEFNRNKLIQSKKFKEERIYIKPNYVGADSIPMPYAKRKNCYVYAGRLEPLKGTEILVKAWEKIGTEDKLILCGTGPMEAWCKEYIQEHGITNIVMLGRIPNTEVRKIISESKALILPTQCYEGFPMTVAEAYSVGTPVIGSDLGNTGDLILNGVTGYKVNRHSEEAIVSAIKNMKDMVQECYGYYQKYLTSESNYEELYKIYCKIEGDN